jgi:hypothetical protein
MSFSKQLLTIVILAVIGGLSFAAGIAWSARAHAAERGGPAIQQKKPKVVYPTKTELDFEGAQIEGELRNPGEFYFQHRHEEKFDSLVKRRKHFHREMLRDAMLSK